MRGVLAAVVFVSIVDLVGCATTSSNRAPGVEAASPPGAAPSLAQIYFWKARPGKFDEYSRYIHDVAEPIDGEAQRRGAVLSVTTYMVRDSMTPWTHMRVFILRDSAQLRALAGALDSAGIRLEPDSAKRRIRGEYSASLRDRVGASTAEMLR